MRYRVEMKLAREDAEPFAHTNLFHDIELPDDFSGEIGMAIREEGCASMMMKSALVIPKAKTKPCMICGTKLESMFDDWNDMQPDGGGEVKIICAYGSVHDQCDGKPLNLVICDACVESLEK